MESFAQPSVVVYLGLFRRAQLPREWDGVFLIVREIRLAVFRH